MNNQTTTTQQCAAHGMAEQEEKTNLPEETPETDFVSVRINSRTYALVKRGTDVAKVKRRYKKRR